MKWIKVNNRSFFSSFGYVFLDLALYVTIIRLNFPRQKAQRGFCVCFMEYKWGPGYFKYPNKMMKYDLPKHEVIRKCTWQELVYKMISTLTINNAVYLPTHVLSIYLVTSCMTTFNCRGQHTSRLGSYSNLLPWNSTYYMLVGVRSDKLMSL